MILKAAACYASTPACKKAAGAHFKAALARLEGEELPEADCAAHRTLETLRLEDPAAMSGCWNPGCACPGTQGLLAWAGSPKKK